MKALLRKAILCSLFFTILLAWEQALCQPLENTEETGQSEVVIGLNLPLTGAYDAQGKDQERVAKLAIETINKEGGVLGRKVNPVIKDTKLNPDVAKDNTLDFIRNGAVMITGGSSSAVAIAQSDVCQERRVIFMAAGTHSNATTGHMETKAGFTVQKAHRHTFRWYFNAWMTNKALTPYLIERYGEGASYYYITADYTWGHSLEESMKFGTEMAACETLGSVRTPLGKSDFRKELRKSRDSGADVLVLVLFGRDMVNALRQADSMGIKKDMDIVVPLMEINMAHSLGPGALENVLSTVQWYWGLRSRFEGTRRFVDDFRTRYGKVPGSIGTSVWVAIHEWASAVERAESFASSAVIRELEGHEFTLLKDKERWREWDHQAVSSVFVVEGKSRKESKGPWDLLKVVAEKEGRSVVRGREANPVTLEKLPGE